MKFYCYAILLTSNLLLPAFGQSNRKLCRLEGKPPHQESLWQDNFPAKTTSASRSVCEGSVNVEDDGRICIDGRVNYKQMVEALGDNPPIYQPAVKSISVTGHLIAGSGNVVLGGKARYLWDFVTSYKVNNVTFQADETIVDNLLTASRGTIDGLCLDPSFRSKESWYSISHNFYLLNNIDLDKIEDNLDRVGLWFFGNFLSVVEYHTPISEPSRITSLFSFLGLSLINFIVGFFPASLYGVFPVFAVTGLSRVVAYGSYSTRQFPNPFIAPEQIGNVEGVQIDTRWDTLVAAVKDGLFTDDRVPLYMNVVIKRIEADGINFKCWGEGTTMASIDVEAPGGNGDLIDNFINDVVYPRLSNFGDVAIHMGKRLPPNSEILESALNFYEKCGAEVGLNINSTKCYHPLCERKKLQNQFQYPDRYFID